jgi:DEAD/DEAH box helicase domain-containing protein
MVEHPSYFFDLAPESGFVDADNMFVLSDHLKCASFELPFDEDPFFPPESAEYLAYLEENGVIRLTGDKYYWADRSFPAEGISLRSATSENVVIVNTTGGKHEVIGEMDRPSAKEMIYDKAVYIHRGNQYFVQHLDLENRKCYVEETKVNYFTDALVKRDIKVLHEDRRDTVAGSTAVIGDILVRTQVSKFKKIRFSTHENIGYGDISLPEEQMHTRTIAVVFAESSPAGDALDGLPLELRGPAIARMGSVIKNVSPVFLLCDRGDIGIAERVRDPHFGRPTLYIYDSYPGGTGLAEACLERFSEILTAARDLVAACPCAEGCPSCVGPRDGQTEIDANPKQAVLTLLDAWVGEVERVGA